MTAKETVMNYESISALSEEIQKQGQFLQDIEREVSKVVVGQRQMIHHLLIGLLANGHILLEGVPGLAKTTAVKALSKSIDASFHRLQFTPDLLPADLIGTLIYNQREATFQVKKGPIFANFILADEINRAAAKVQSALLESMQESQVTIGDTTYPLAPPFFVLATQNPIEQEGTYPLPEAQVDRFMFKVLIDYPEREEEMLIMRRGDSSHANQASPVAKPEQIIAAQNLVDQIHLDEKVENYILDIVFATRNPEKYGLKELKNKIRYGASPRASIYLVKAAKAHAFLQNRAYVVPEDIRAIGYEVLRHRVMISFEAEADEQTSDDIIKLIFGHFEVP
jgi:MoxR-like ATPase